jgi:carboxylesterase type B
MRAERAEARVGSRMTTLLLCSLAGLAAMGAGAAAFSQTPAPLPAPPVLRVESGLFHKTIAESGGSRDSVLTARPMSKDGVDPNYPVSAETIGTQFARSMGIEGTDEAALARLRALGAEEVLRGAPAPPGGSVPSYETTPILDGKLVTETAEAAYKARHQPRVPFMAGSNSADTAGNRVKATTKEQLWARYGQWSTQAKAAYDPDGSAAHAAAYGTRSDTHTLDSSSFSRSKSLSPSVLRHSPSISARSSWILAQASRPRPVKQTTRARRPFSASRRRT